MGWFSKKQEEETPLPPVYEQPIVHHEKPTYDDQAKPTPEQEDIMLDFALGHSYEGMVEELAEQGWVYGRQGWRKRA